MNRAEWQDVIEGVRMLWGQSSRWAEAEQAYNLVENIPYQAMDRAFRSAQTDNRATAPTLNQLIQTATQTATGAQPILTGQGWCDRHGHRWGIVEYEDDAGHPGKRLIVCAACHEERLVDPAKMRNQTEADDQATADRERLIPVPDWEGRRDLQ